MATRDRSHRARRARHRRLARPRPRRRADARARRRRRRDRRPARRVGAVRGDRRATAPLATVARTQGLVGTESAAEEIRAMGRRALAVRCDVTDREQVAAAVARAVDELGSVDILVNNAGTLDHVGQFARPVARALGARPARQPDRRLQLRAGGLAAHEGARWGRIVNMASVAGTLGGFGQASLLDDEGRAARPDEDARDGGRPARDHGNAIVPGIIGTEAFHLANAGDERADREPDGLQAARASRRTSRTRSPSSAPTSRRTSPGIELNVSGGVELFVF